MKKKYGLVKNYIGGTWISSTGEKCVDIINPATGESIGQTPLSTQQDVAHAVVEAKKAFLTWRKTPAVERVQYLFKLKTLMEERLEELSHSVTEEHGKTLVEARGSVRRGIQMLETAAGIPSLMMGENFEDIAQGIDCSTVQRPMGVFACIAPFNFPVMVPFWFWPYAIACGNTFILKASERVPLTSILVFKMLEEIGLPKGVMNLVHGAHDVVNALCTHPDIKGVSFVGSTPVAKHVYTLATSHGKRVQALGGAKNVMVVMPDAMETSCRQRNVNTAVESIIGCAGERCLAGSLVLAVGDETYEKFRHDSTLYAKNVVVGPGLDPKSNMGPLISASAKERVLGLIERALKEGATLLYDGRNVGEYDKGFFLRPTVLGDIHEDMEIAKVEIFGPVILLGKVNSLDESIQWINRIELANTTTLFTNSGATARKFVYSVDPSMIGINIGVPAPMSFFSFGGSKESFFGDIKVHGKQSIHFFTETYTTIYRWFEDGEIWSKK